MSFIKFHGKKTELEGNFVEVGKEAPDFLLVNKDLEDVSLSSFNNKKKIISIVPSLDTPVCALSTRKFNQEVSKQLGTGLFIVSADLPFAMSRFCSTEGLNNVITLSTMRSQKFAVDYGVLIKTGALRGITARAVITLDEEDTVLFAQLVDDMKDEPNYDGVLSSLVKTA